MVPCNVVASSKDSTSKWKCALFPLCFSPSLSLSLGRFFPPFIFRGFLRRACVDAWTRASARESLRRPEERKLKNSMAGGSTSEPTRTHCIYLYSLVQVGFSRRLFSKISRAIVARASRESGALVFPTSRISFRAGWTNHGSFSPPAASGLDPTDDGAACNNITRSCRVSAPLFFFFFVSSLPPLFFLQPASVYASLFHRAALRRVFFASSSGSPSSPYCLTLILFAIDFYPFLSRGRKLSVSFASLSLSLIAHGFVLPRLVEHSILSRIYILRFLRKMEERRNLRTVFIYRVAVSVTRFVTWKRAPSDEVSCKFKQVSSNSTASFFNCERILEIMTYKLLI